MGRRVQEVMEPQLRWLRNGFEMTFRRMSGQTENVSDSHRAVPGREETQLLFDAKPHACSPAGTAQFAALRNGAPGGSVESVFG